MPPKPSKAPALMKALEHAAVEQAEIRARAEVHERSEGAVVLPEAHDGVDGRLAHVLDGGQPEAEHLALHREARARSG